MKWSNVGVGKLYRPYVLRIAVRDAAGQTVGTADSEADPRDWLPGDHAAAVSCRVPSDLTPGEYSLAVALLGPSNQRQPLRVAIDTPSVNGWNTISRLRIE
jgi:hypothetical protein